MVIEAYITLNLNSNISALTDLDIYIYILYCKHITNYTHYNYMVWLKYKGVVHLWERQLLVLNLKPTEINIV